MKTVGLGKLSSPFFPHSLRDLLRKDSNEIALGKKANTNDSLPEMKELLTMMNFSCLWEYINNSL
jgi:hypothetical protein